MLTQDGIGPVLYSGELHQVRLAVQADPGGSGGTARRNGVQCVGDGPGESLEPRDEVQITRTKPS